MASNHEGSTVIGESFVVHGNVNGDEDLNVRGRVEGTITLTKTLLVEPGGVVKAEVQVRNCVVSGTVEGNVVASESVEITKEGRMVGDISSPRVIIVDGATFNGRIDMGEVEGEGAEGERATLARASSRPQLRAPPRPAAAPALAARAGEDEKPTPAAVKPLAPPVPVAMGAVKRKVIVRRK